MLTDVLQRNKLRIVKFGGEYFPKDDELDHLKKMIEECEDLYPGIDIWFKKKVSSDLITGERQAILIYSNDKPIGSAILRKGDNAKLCSMRVVESFQKDGIGSLLMALIGLELRRNKIKDIHFTIPENIWDSNIPFFEDYGFQNHGEAENQYRLFFKEFACSSNFSNVWNQVMETLPNLLLDSQLNEEHPLPEILLSLHPRYAEKILSGEKTVEIRRGFPSKWKGSLVTFYATSPQQELVGEAVISNVESNTPDYIWQKYERDIGCSHEEYKIYCNGKAKISALKFNHVIPYRNRTSRVHLEMILDRDLRPPQSYNIVRNNSGWMAAVSLGKLMRNRS